MYIIRLVPFCLNHYFPFSHTILKKHNMPVNFKLDESAFFHVWYKTEQQHQKRICPDELAGNHLGIIVKDCPILRGARLPHSPQR